MMKAMFSLHSKRPYLALLHKFGLGERLIGYPGSRREAQLHPR
jgi:hypothetical protein